MLCTIQFCCFTCPVGEPILNPVPLSSPRAPSPTIPQVIPEMTFDLLPSSPKHHEDTNPFRSGGMPMSPMIHRHNAQQTEPLSADALEIQTTLSKAKSLVSLLDKRVYKLTFKIFIHAL